MANPCGMPHSFSPVGLEPLCEVLRAPSSLSHPATLRTSRLHNCLCSCPPGESAPGQRHATPGARRRNYVAMLATPGSRRFASDILAGVRQLGQPPCYGWGGRIRTSECVVQSHVPYHLATPHRLSANAKPSSTALRAWVE